MKIGCAGGSSSVDISRIFNKGYVVWQQSKKKVLHLQDVYLRMIDFLVKLVKPVNTTLLDEVGLRVEGMAALSRQIT